MAGEERQLRAGLRQLEAQQSAAEQCQLASMSLGGGNGGVDDGLRAIEQTLRLILSQEAAHAGAQEHSLPTAGLYRHVNIQLIIISLYAWPLAWTMLYRPVVWSPLPTC